MKHHRDEEQRKQGWAPRDHKGLGTQEISNVVEHGILEIHTN